MRNSHYSRKELLHLIAGLESLAQLQDKKYLVYVKNQFLVLFCIYDGTSFMSVFILSHKDQTFFYLDELSPSYPKQQTELFFIMIALNKCLSFLLPSTVSQAAADFVPALLITVHV